MHYFKKKKKISCDFGGWQVTFYVFISREKTCRNSLGGKRIPLWLSIILEAEELLISWFKSLHLQWNSCGVICGSSSLQWQLLENLLPKFPWILTRSCRRSLRLRYLFCPRFSNFYRPSLHVPLWGQGYFCASCFEQLLGHPRCQEVQGWLVLPQPWGAESCPGAHPLSMHSHPEPFRCLKSSGEGRNWEEPGEEVIEALVVGSWVQDKTLGQKGSAGSFSFWFFPQTSSTKPSTTSPNA